MSKGLEALQRIKNRLYPLEIEETKIIEKELKELEVRRKMMRKFDLFMKRYNIDSVEELDTFFNEHLNNDIDKCSKCKELKALEIIKNKECIFKGLQDVSQEEYDLLKEVLKWLHLIH